MTDNIANNDRMMVALRDLRIELPIGIADWEVVGGKTQLVIMDIELHAPCPSQPPSDISECISYDDIMRYIHDDIAKRGHTGLLETLAHDITSYLLDNFPIDSCRVSLRKPHVYNGAAIPEVSLLRHQTEARRT